MELTISGLKVEVEGKEILRGVDLVVKSGEVHAIMGPNGSGKSTLAYTLMGHPKYKIVQGSVTLNQINVLELTPGERAKAGIFLAFQHPVTVEGVDVITFLWRVKRTIIQSSMSNNQSKDIRKNLLGFRDFKMELVEVCEKLNLGEEFLKRKLNDGFSGGERKKLEILQMLVFKPKVVILDETDSGTDVDAMKLIAKRVGEYIKLQNEIMVIIITHYSKILSYISPNYVHVFLDGKIIRSGGPKLAGEVEENGYRSLEQ